MVATDMNKSVLFDHMQGRGQHTNRIAVGSAPHVRRCIKAGLATVVQGLLVLTDAGLEAQKLYDAKAAPQMLARAKRELEAALVRRDMAETRAEPAHEMATYNKTVARYETMLAEAEAWVARLTK